MAMDFAKVFIELRRWMDHNEVDADGVAVTIDFPTDDARQRAVHVLYEEFNVWVATQHDNGVSLNMYLPFQLLGIRVSLTHTPRIEV